MSFYIAFNNISSFLETSEFLDSTGDGGAAVDDSVKEASQAAAPEARENLLPELGDLPENPVFAIDGSEITIAAVSQISPAIEFNAETLEAAAEAQNPKIEAENLSRHDSYEKFHALLKKFEISLHYRYDLTDVFTTDRETKNSQNLGRLIEKNLGKQRAARQEDVEKRFQEKQAEDFKKHLKRKRFAGQLQNKTKTEGN